jgi:hypothetical protein
MLSLASLYHIDDSVLNADSKLLYYWQREM